jgi:DNA-binding IscR family transcriptional regulator
MTGCVMGFAECQGREHPCPLHAPWNEVKEYLEQTLSTVTIRDLQLVDLRTSADIGLRKPGMPACLPLGTMAHSLAKPS